MWEITFKIVGTVSAVVNYRNLDKDAQLTSIGLLFRNYDKKYEFTIRLKELNFKILRAIEDSPEINKISLADSNFITIDSARVQNPINIDAVLSWLVTLDDSLKDYREDVLTAVSECVSNMPAGMMDSEDVDAEHEEVGSPAPSLTRMGSTSSMY